MLLSRTPPPSVSPPSQWGSRAGVPVGNVVPAVGRQTGFDSALRRGLGGNRRGSSGGGQRADTKKSKTNSKDGDLEKGEEILKVLAQ